jgi:hypothetical protein
MIALEIVNFNGDDSIIPLSDQFIRDFVSAEGV